MQRTADWNRLKSAGFFTIEDQPGMISLTSKNHLRIVVALLWGPPALFLFSMVFKIWGLALASFVVSLIMFFPMIIAYRNLSGFAYKVVMLPDRLEFYGWNGKSVGFLQREAMQQIEVQPEPNNSASHAFLADNGYIKAFPKIAGNNATVSNNILVAAFNQPIWNDGAQLHSANDYTAPPAQPNLDGLRPQAGTALDAGRGG